MTRRGEVPAGLQARMVWDGLEIRMPAILAAVKELTEDEVRERPPNRGNSIAWLLWHIAEVEDNWIRTRLLALPPRFPFETSVRRAAPDVYPGKSALLTYLSEVRDLSKERLLGLRDDQFDRQIDDEHFGRITIRQLWMGVVTSCAWHGGQIVLIANRVLGKAGDKPPGE